MSGRTAACWERIKQIAMLLSDKRLLLRPTDGLIPATCGRLPRMKERPLPVGGKPGLCIRLWVEAEAATLSLISQPVRETDVRLGQFREFSEERPGMSIEAPIVIDARNFILVLTKQLL